MNRKKAQLSIDKHNGARSGAVMFILKNVKYFDMHHGKIYCRFLTSNTGFRNYTPVNKNRIRVSEKLNYDYWKPDPGWVKVKYRLPKLNSDFPKLNPDYRKHASAFLPGPSV